MPVVQRRAQGMGEPIASLSASPRAFTSAHAIKVVASQPTTRAVAVRSAHLRATTRATRPTATRAVRGQAVFNTKVASGPVKAVVSTSAKSDASALPNPKAGGGHFVSAQPSIVRSATRSQTTLAAKTRSVETEFSTPSKRPVKVVKPADAATSGEEASASTRAAATSAAATQPQAATTTTRNVAPQGNPVRPEDSVTTTERVFGNNASATKIAAVVPTRAPTQVQAVASSIAPATTQIATSPLANSPPAAVAQTQAAAQSNENTPSILYASLAATSSEHIFNGGSSTQIAAVSQAAATMAALAGASSGAAQGNPVPVSVVGGVSVSESAQASATIAGGSAPAASSSATASGSSTGTNKVGSGVDLFHSLPRSTSLALTVLLVFALLGLLGCCCGCFIMRRRRRRSRGTQLGSENGSIREKFNEKYPGARALNDNEAGNPFGDGARVEDDGEDDDSIQPEALWRRRLNRLNNSSGWDSANPHMQAPQSVATADMTERRGSFSTWTSFDGVGTFYEESEMGAGSLRQRQASHDMAISGYSIDPPSVVFAGEQAQQAQRYGQHFGLAADRHPLAMSFIPLTPSQYSEHSADMTPTGSPSKLHPFNPTSPAREALPGFGLVTLSSNSPPVPASNIRPPTTPGAWRSSLDKIMGSAVEFLAGKSDSRRGSYGSLDDRYTSFMAPRRAPPTPLARANTISVPPKAATTMGMFGPTDRSVHRRLSYDSIDSNPTDAVEVMTARHLGSAKGVRTSLQSVGAPRATSDTDSIKPSRTGLGLSESIVPIDATSYKVSSTSSRPHAPTKILVTAPSPEMPARPYAGFAPIDDPEDVSPTSSPRVNASPKAFSPTSPNPAENPFAEYNASILDRPFPPRERSNGLTPSATRPIFSIVSPFAPRAMVPPSPIVEEDEGSSRSGSPSSLLHGRAIELDGNESSNSEESQAPTIRARRSSASFRNVPQALINKANRRHSLTGLPIDLLPSSERRRSSASSQLTLRTGRTEPISKALSVRRLSFGIAAPSRPSSVAIRRSASVDMTAARAPVVADEESSVASSEGSDEGSEQLRLTQQQKEKRFEQMERTRSLMAERRRRSEGELIPRA
ncbi:BZ3500_MvSof-1268-A1-R1_Chr6-3g08739 [Microbotryum saponariae]|uniref:BZ3500_MvSof-1268-A1-R1_Chr6-3g08739 protein n=1 Tax=Microbotryum saponariae TaxID=289078 RepID=A0A2X0KJD3_9BASI|nr:BZ3500_MvSof-1268-A1-R1_Chr6-3g08739 [Microbotryum saponariae]SDA07340.1 BZ3501_MvSof-1269-A2-R1_Chr6-2g08442 [Microbotryum saponariae]